MTAWVRTDCPECGGLYLPIADVSAWMVLPAVACSYSFACLHCRRLVERPCSTATLDELARCGVSLTTLVAPAEVGWPGGDGAVGSAGSAGSVSPLHAVGRVGPTVPPELPSRGAPEGPLDESDADEFCRLLADDDAFAHALRRLGDR